MLICRISELGDYAGYMACILEFWVPLLKTTSPLPLPIPQMPQLKCFISQGELTYRNIKSK